MNGMEINLPYTPPTSRAEIDPSLRLLIKDLAHDFSAANLNYIYCTLANAYIEHHGLRYPRICEVQGVFHGAAREFDRRVADPYEALKEAQNGTVWNYVDTIQEMVNDAVEIVTEDRDDLPEEIRCEETKQTWHRCLHPECNLHLIGPGTIDCDGFCLDDDEDWNLA